MNIAFQIHSLKDKETGLLLHFSQCDELAIGWIDRVPFCKTCLPDRWYMPVTQEKEQTS